MASRTSVDRQRREVLDIVQEHLRGGEKVVGILPFALVPKRPKGPEGKVRDGLYQSYRRYRPLAVTTRRLFVLETGRTPHPRGFMTTYELRDVHFVDLVPTRFGHRLLLDFPEVGTVPFVLGRFDLEDLDDLRSRLGKG